MHNTEYAREELIVGREEAWMKKQPFIISDTPASYKN